MNDKETTQAILKRLEIEKLKAKIEKLKAEIENIQLKTRLNEQKSRMIPILPIVIGSLLIISVMILYKCL